MRLVAVRAVPVLVLLATLVVSAGPASAAAAPATLGYKVYRDGVYVQTVAAPATTATIGGGTPLGSHAWMVRATAIGNYHAAASNPVTVTVSDTTRPSTPTGLTVVGYPTTSSVQLTWGGSTDVSGVAGYRVYRMVGASPATTDPLLASPVASPAVVSSIVAGWSLYVKAVDVISPVNVSWSSNRVTMAPAAQVPSPPGTPTLTAVTANGNVSMTWPLVAGATSYDVYRDLSGTEVSNYNNNGTPLPTSKRVGTGVTVGAFTDPAGLASGATHNWWVVAKNASGASDLSPSAQAVICSRLTSPENRWRTASVCGTWQLLNPQGYVDQFHAVRTFGVTASTARNCRKPTSRPCRPCSTPCVSTCGGIRCNPSTGPASTQCGRNGSKPRSTGSRRPGSST